jgi:type IV pilus assembly protein PilA
MLKMIRKQMNKKGFTLIELVVVIAILAILAAIAVPQLLGFQDRAREQADKQTAVQIRNALSLLNANGEIVLSDGGTYTVAVAGTVTVVGIALNTDPVGADGVGVQALVEELTDTIAVEGTSALIIEVQEDGEVEVTSP